MRLSLSQISWEQKGFEASRKRPIGHGQMLGILYIFFQDRKYFHALKLFFLVPDVSLNLSPVTQAQFTLLWPWSL